MLKISCSVRYDALSVYVEAYYDNGTVLWDGKAETSIDSEAPPRSSPLFSFVDELITGRIAQVQCERELPDTLDTTDWLPPAEGLP